MAMTYEAYLDEVTTLITEMYDVSEEAAIKQVMRAQAADFFTLHDDILAMRTQERGIGGEGEVPANPPGADGSGAEAAEAISTTTAAETSRGQHAQKVIANTSTRKKTAWTTV